MRTSLLAAVLLLLACGSDASSAAGAVGAPKTLNKPVFDHKAPPEAKGLDIKSARINDDVKGLEKIVAPDMVQKIVAPDMLQSSNKIVAPDMVQKIVAPDMVQKPDITPPGPGPKPLTPPPTD